MCPTPNEQLKEPNASGQKQIQIVNLANQLDNKLRKDFIKKQQQLRRQPSRGEDTEVDVDSQALNTGRNFDDVKVIIKKKSLGFYFNKYLLIALTTTVQKNEILKVLFQ